MMEIVLSAAASPRLSQDSSVAGQKEQCLQPQYQREVLGKCPVLSSIHKDVCIFKTLNHCVNDLV